MRRAALALLYSCLAGLSPWAVGACSYDWTVRQVTPDASAVDATTSLDAGSSDLDGALAADGSQGDAGTPDDAGACASLAASAESAKVKARACALASGQCLTKQKDECGCDVFVALASGAADTAFASAVAAFTGASCAEPASCPTPCPTLPVQGTCLQEADGGTSCLP